jgi:hypothetical protein
MSRLYRATGHPVFKVLIWTDPANAG